ncbi:MAG TPA: hypothetical protein VFA63_08270, partial [Pseudonocardiaceae bacterium]|nr:hypothetical protein [Pseudonocardiaceae bacterium]
TDETPDPVWPRWVGYFSLFVALSSFGGAVAVYFKTGPLAYNGLIAFWLVMVGFMGWITIMIVCVHRWTVRQPVGAGSVFEAQPPVPVNPA